MIRITNESSLPEPERPQVYFSGALHGNERIGPTATLEFAILLVDHASRSNGNAWLQHLVNTRMIYITPTTNAYGYSHNARGELGTDTNRDYNYMHAPKCMQTMTSRVVNELFRDHIFQLAITFHAGMRAVGK